MAPGIGAPAPRASVTGGGEVRPKPQVAGRARAAAGQCPRFIRAAQGLPAETEKEKRLLWQVMGWRTASAETPQTPALVAVRVLSGGRPSPSVPCRAAERQALGGRRKAFLPGRPVASELQNNCAVWKGGGTQVLGGQRAGNGPQ